MDGRSRVGSTTVRLPDDASPRRAWTLVAVGVAAPWTWFHVRSARAWLEADAVLLPLLALVAVVVVVVGAAVRRRPPLLLIALSVLAAATVAIVGPRLPHPGPEPLEPLRLVSANVFSDNPAPAAAVVALLAQGADVEVAVETSPGFRADLTAQDTAHPYSAVDDQLVVRSRYPIQPLEDPPNVPARRILRVQIEGPGGPFVLYAVHALNPLSESTFGDQLTWVRRLRAAAAREAVPVVMAGDFNMSDRQVGYRELAGDLRDAITASGWGRSTYGDGLWATLFLRIDHVFESRTWCASGAARFDVPGSDHEGVAVSLGPCP
jgi:endonuclease/exonuclease/phosphatase (EEP) superfamily protein YafD